MILISSYSDTAQRPCTQGYEQFLASKKEMLDDYDKSKNLDKADEIETEHGKVAEAKFREWLSIFLPKKYAVTPGYIVSQGMSDENKLPHFDVIIYDHLESPVLWIKGNPDLSQRGTSRAIPAEHVRAVIEP
ncbi:MAG: hypothetical protein PHS80_09145 [Methanothrix sp.]|nr:hypothetical protein [Methanothrix sp.]